MGNMIKTAPGFQYSVNIAFDLNNDDNFGNYGDGGDLGGFKDLLDNDD